MIDSSLAGAACVVLAGLSGLIAGYFIGYCKGMFSGIVTHVVIEDPLDVIYPKKEKEVDHQQCKAD